MSISTSKSILITPGSFSSSNNAISQIDLKWVESGVGTFVFRPNVNDLRSTIYNWQQNSEPVILFGGMGTVNGVRKFAGPYQDYTGTFSGITSFPQIQFFPLSGTIYANTLTLSGIASFNQIYSAGLSTFGSINLLGPLYDQTFNSGSVNQVLTSTVNGVAWSTPSTYGNISGLGITNYVSKFSNSTSLTTSNIIDNGSLVTVGIGMSVNGFTTVAGSFVSTGNAGIGTNINSNVRLVTRSADSTSATESFRAVDSSGTASLQINGAGFVGIGSLSAIYRLNVFHNTTNANIGAYQANLEVTQTAATARSILGGRFSVTGRINATSTNNIYGIYGVIGFSYASAGVTNSGEVAAGAFDARISNANHSGTNAMQMAVFGMYNASASATGLGTIQNAYGGRFIADYGFPANFTIQNSFGVRVQSTNSTSYPQNSFGFYEDLASAANAKNFFLNPVGIGTSSPTQNLHVQGNARLTGGLYDSTNSQGSLSQILSSTGSGIAWTSFNSSGIFTGTVAPNQVAIGSTGNRLQGFSTFIFDSTGLSIGTSIPEQRLTVSGNVKATGTVTANQFISTTFTDPPLVVNSQSLVTNLNSEYWKDQAYPLSTIGDLLYSSDNSGTAARLAPNTTTVIKVLTQVGDGVEASAPSWQPLPSSGFLQYFFTGLAATNAPQNYQLANDLPVGLGTTSINFTSGEALVAQFITDPGVPNLEFLPAGNLTAYVWGLQTISTTIAAVPTVQLRVDFYETTSLGTSIAKIASSNDSTELVPTAERYTLIGITTGTYNLASRSSRIQARVYAVHGLTGIATINVFYGNGYDSLVQIVAPGADVTNFVPYQGAVNNVDLGIKNLRAGAVGLYTGFSTVAPEQGQFIWNSTTQEVDLGLSDGYSVSVGFENALRVYNNTLNTIGVGSVVYVTGAAGNIPTVDLASASLFDSSTVVGVTNRFIAPASYGYIYTYGTIDYNTSSFVSGDNLFLSDTQAGILTSISPLAPSFSVLVGTVLNSGTSGSIVVLQNSINSLNESSRILFANSNKFPQGISTFVYSRGNVGIGTTAPTQNLHVQGNARLTGGLYDNANSPGSLGQILSSTGSGIAWTSVNTTGILTANGGISNRVTKFLDEDTLGNSNITDTGTLITLGSGVTVSGILTSFGYYGPGTFITNLNASNLASGTVPSSVVSGSYSGITSVGSLTQLNVTGITTSNIFVGNGSNITNLNASNLTSGIVNANRISGSYSGITSVGTLTQLNVAGITTSTSIRISNQLYDSNFSSGTQNQLLVSTGVGISWTSSQATGIITGTGAATRLAYFADANTLTSNSNFIIDSFGQFGISTTIPRNRLDVYATARFSGQVIFYGSTSNDAFGLTQQFDSTYQGTNNVLRFRQGGSTAGAVAFSFYDFLPNIFMTLDGSSLPRVGIGTTGPLQTLHVGGNALISGLTTSTGFFGPGTNITNLNASNLIFGTVPSVVVSGTYSGITSVGTLSQLNVSGITTSTVFVGNGSNITNLNASNLASGIVPSSTISGSYSGITSVGNLTQLNVTGITTLQNLELNGWLLDANNSSGSLGQILSSTGTGVAWTSVNTTGILTATGGISNRVSKFLDEDTLGNSNITDTGTLITLGSAVSVSGILTSFGFFGPGTNLTNLNASNLTSGTVPSAVVSGAYSGITSVGTLSQLNVSGTGSMTNLFVSGQFGVSTASVRGANIDLNNDVRISGALDLYGGIANTTQSLVFRYDSTYSGVTDVLRFRGTNVAANAYAFTIFDRPPNLWMTSVGALPRVGIGKTSPTTTLDVEGTITATGFSGPGTNLTNLNASNLASGTVPSAVVSGVYSGITSVGTLTQLNVSGITTVTNLQLSGWLRDSSSSIGSTGQILSSTGTGIAWTTVSSTGILTGNGIQNVVAKFNSSSSLTTSNISDNGIAVTVGSQIFVNGIGSFTGDITVNSITIGLGSGQITTNTVVGNSALTSNTTGSNNVSVGRLTLNSNVTGAQNVAIGAEALRYYTTVSNQVAIGYQALAGSATSSFNTGTQNTAIGHQAGLANTSGTDNTFIGYQAGVANTSGYQNSIFGSFAFAGNLTGFQNTAFGYLALRNNISGNTNVAVGRQSLYSNTSGGNNVAIGNNSMFWSVSGNNNTFVGGLSGFYQSGQSSQTAVGYNALAGNSDTTLNTGQLNTAFGFNAGAANTSGSFNVFVGYNAGVANTSGSSNSFFGYFAGSNNLTANNNTFVGSTAGTNTRSGSGNVAMGISALNQNTSGTHNVAIGRQSAYYSVTASDLVAVGNNALFYYTGSGSNTAVGSGALFGNATTALNTGTENTAVGQSAGLANTAGTQNVFVGHTAGNNNTTGSQNTYLGHSAGLSNITDNYQIAVGFGVSPVGSNRGAIGRNANASRTDIGIGTYAPLSRVHIETLAAGNMGLYIAGSASQTGDLVEINATTFGQNYFTITGVGSVGIYTNTPSQALDVNGNIRIRNGLLDSNNSLGTNNQILISTGTGISWTAATATGILTGNGITNNVPKFGSPTSLTTSNITDNGIAVTVNSRLNVVGIGSFTNDIIVNQITVGLGSNNVLSNVALGYQALLANPSSSTSVVAIGNQAMSNASGSWFASIAIGDRALQNNQGSRNVAIGVQALAANTTGASNIAIGYQALQANTTDSGNIAIGNRVMWLLTGGSGGANIAIGGAQNLTTAAEITVVGASAANNYTSQGQHVAIGAYALGGVSTTAATGTQNTAVGYAAMTGITGGSSNVGLGHFALNALTSGNSNTGLGYLAASSNTTGGFNVAVGREALRYYVAVSNQVAVGYQALQGSATTTFNTGTQNVAVGYQAGLVNSSGTSNTFVGYRVGLSNTSGNSNSSFGFESLLLNTVGNSNSAFGNNALYSNTSGINNSALGLRALYSNTTGSENTGVGLYALNQNTIGLYNVAVGNYALEKYVTPSNNTALGYGALTGNASVQLNTGSNNVAVGTLAGSANTSGSNNTFVGRSSGVANTSGSNNAFLGYLAGDGMLTGSNNTFVGESSDGASGSSYQIAMGRAVIPTASNLGAWGGNTNSTRTDLGIGTFTPLSRLHLETLAAGNMGLYIAGSASQTGDLVEINATTYGQNYFTVNGVGSVGIYTNTPSQALDVNGNVRIRNGLLDSNNSLGINNQVLISTGTGIAWTTVSSTGILTGNGIQNVVAKFNSSSSLTTSNITDNGVAVTVGSQIFVNGVGSFTGDIYVNSMTVGLGSGQVATNTAVGFQALLGVTTGAQVTAVGYRAMTSNTTGSFNAAFGNSALTSNTTGSNNVSVGRLTLNSNVTGAQNVAIGAEALRYYSTVSNQVAIGYQALAGSATSTLNTGTQNVAVGYQAGIANSSGSRNVFVGYLAGTANTSGNNNNFIGNVAGFNNLTGANNQALGSGALASLRSGNNHVAIGNAALFSLTGSIDNIGIGFQAAYSVVSGDANIAIGRNALFWATSASNNVAIGYQAMFNLSNPSNQTAIGHQALQGSATTSFNTGTQNTAVGYQAGIANSSGSSNVFVGYQAGFANTSGIYNTVVGSLALTANTTGGYNNAFGYLALAASTSADFNNAFGQGALQANTTGTSNSGFGHNALAGNTTGGNNVAIGILALVSNTTSNNNVAIGRSALRYYNQAAQVAVGYEALTGNSTVAFNTGTQNTAIGFQAGTANTSGTSNVFVGYQAGLANTSGSENVALGVQALLANLSGTGNVALGQFTLAANTAGSNSTAVGQYALQNNTAGGNSAFGATALRANTTGYENTAIGYVALVSNTTGFQNSALGLRSLQNNTTGGGNVAVGRDALRYYQTSNNQTAVGTNALAGNTTVALNTGTQNTALGVNAGVANTSGSNNAFMGYQAGLANTTGNQNTFIGAQSGDGNTTGNSNTYLGYLTDGSPTGSYQIAIGDSVTLLASNQGAWGGNTNSTRTNLGVGTYAPLSRVHIETLAAGNQGLYIAGSASQTANLLEIDAATNGSPYLVVNGVGSVGIYTSTPAAALHSFAAARIDNGLTLNATTADTKTQRIFAGASISTSSTSFVTIASLAIPTGFTLNLEAKINGWVSTALNESGKAFGVFYNNAGTAVQVGTTDVVSKYLGVGGNFDIQTSGANVNIVVKSNSGITTWFWKTQYDYLLTQNS